MKKVDALHSLRPGAQWVLRGDVLEWLDTEQTCPTDEEITAYMEANAYKDLRAAEYPSIPDQFDLLYHGGYDAWKAAIQAVKDKYPKGQA